MKTKKTKFDYRTIKSFEDACKKIGVDPTALPDVSMIPEEFRASIIAMYKLYVIYKAINNEWEANYGDSNQEKYWPYYRVLSSGSGFDFSLTFYGYASSYSLVGSRLCTYSREVALYIADQFQEEYKAIFLKS
jgi:hypothetical protein